MATHLEDMRHVYDWIPSLADVSHHLNTYLRDEYGNPLTTFTDTTPITVASVENAIVLASEMVVGKIPGREIPGGARFCAAIGAASIVLIDHDPSLSDLLNNRFKEMLGELEEASYRAHRRKIEEAYTPARFPLTPKAVFPSNQTRW